MMVERRCKIHRILALIGGREADYLGVILGLLVDIGHFVDRVGNLLDANHAHLRTCQPLLIKFSAIGSPILPTPTRPTVFILTPFTKTAPAAYASSSD